MHHIPARIRKPEGASRLSRLLVLFAALVFATPAALTLPAFAQDPAPAAKPADHKPADGKPAPEWVPFVRVEKALDAARALDHGAPHGD